MPAPPLHPRSFTICGLPRYACTDGEEGVKMSLIIGAVASDGLILCGDERNFVTYPTQTKYGPDIASRCTVKVFKASEQCGIATIGIDGLAQTLASYVIAQAGSSGHIFFGDVKADLQAVCASRWIVPSDPSSLAYAGLMLAGYDSARQPKIGFFESNYGFNENLALAFRYRMEGLNPFAHWLFERLYAPNQSCENMAVLCAYVIRETAKVEPRVGQPGPLLIIKPNAPLKEISQADMTVLLTNKASNFAAFDLAFNKSFWEQTKNVI